MSGQARAGQCDIHLNDQVFVSGITQSDRQNGESDWRSLSLHDPACLYALSCFLLLADPQADTSRGQTDQSQSNQGKDRP